MTNYWCRCGKDANEYIPIPEHTVKGKLLMEWVCEGCKDFLDRMRYWSMISKDKASLTSFRRRSSKHA